MAEAFQSGYWLVTRTGQVYPYGGSQLCAGDGVVTGPKIVGPIIGAIDPPKPFPDAFTLVNAAGALFTFTCPAF